MPNSGSVACPPGVRLPETCTSLPSLLVSSFSGDTLRTMPAPSDSDLAVVTARPSFQNSSAQEPAISTKPKTTPANDSPMR